MGSLASKSRQTTIHVTQIQETHLEVKGKRMSPKEKPSGRTLGQQQSTGGAPGVVSSGRYVKSITTSAGTYHSQGTEMTASEKQMLADARGGYIWKSIKIVFLPSACCGQFHHQ